MHLAGGRTGDQLGIQRSDLFGNEAILDGARRVVPVGERDRPQPEQAGAIRGTMILMAALVEGVALITVVFCLVLSFVA